MYTNNGMVSRFLQFPFNLMSVIISIIAGSLVVLYVKDKGIELVTQEGTAIKNVSNTATSKAVDTVQNMTG